MAQSYLTTQIPDVVKDAVSDLLGTTKATKLVADGLVSLGQALEDMDLLDGWFGALANRIVDTRYMVRAYEPYTRKLLRNEHEFGAFVQRVYYTDAPDPVENPAYAAPDEGSYKQVSPYDVEGSIAVTALVYGGTGTWSFEFIRPVSQIKKAFTSGSEMDAFIAGLYLYADNKFKLHEEAIANLAANTGIAIAIGEGLERDLLSEYNQLHDDAVLTRAEALRSADFFKYASKEISRIIENMGRMTTVFNAQGYETYTPADQMVVEMLTEFAKASDVYLEADTYHNELVALPNFERVAYWQSPGSKDFKFEDCSAINIELDNDTTNVDGVIAFLHDMEYVAATIKDRYTWEEFNKRQRVMIHGEQAEEGYAVDKFMNAMVIRVGAGNGAITVSGDASAVLSLTHAYANVENTIKVSDSSTAPTATGVTFTKVSGSDDTYTFTPVSNEAFTITVA